MKNRRKRNANQQSVVDESANSPSLPPPSSTPADNPKSHEQCNGDRLIATAEQIAKCVEQKHLVLVLMRGLSGSGKSTLARSLIEKRPPSEHIFSTDDFFFNHFTGEYVHDVTKLHEYHLENQKLVKRAIAKCTTPIFVDNTNIHVVSMMPYARMAVEAGYEIYTLTPDTEWANKIGECTRRSKHKISREVQQRWVDEWEKIDSVQRLTGSVGKKRHANEDEKQVDTPRPPSPCVTPRTQSSTSSILRSLVDESSNSWASLAEQPWEENIPPEASLTVIDDTVVAAGDDSFTQNTTICMKPADTRPMSTVRVRSIGTQCEELSILIALSSPFAMPHAEADFSHTGFPNDEAMQIGEECSQDRRELHNPKHRSIETDVRWPPYVLTILTMRFEDATANLVINLLIQHNDNVCMVVNELLRQGVHPFIPQSNELHSLMYSTDYAITLYDPMTYLLDSASGSTNSSGYNTNDDYLNSQSSPSSTVNLVDFLPDLETSIEAAQRNDVMLVEQFAGDAERRVWHRALKLVTDPNSSTGVYSEICLREQHLSVDVDVLHQIYSRLDLYLTGADTSDLHPVLMHIQTTLHTYAAQTREPSAEERARLAADLDMARILSDELNLADDMPPLHGGELCLNEKINKLKLAYPNADLIVLQNALTVVNESLADALAMLQFQLGDAKDVSFGGVVAKPSPVKAATQPHQLTFGNVMNNLVDFPPAMQPSSRSQSVTPSHSQSRLLGRDEVFTQNSTSEQNANEYADRREEAFQLDSEAKQLRIKSQYYHSRHMPSVASVYSRQAGEKKAAAHRLHKVVATTMADSRARSQPANFLDLHAFHQDEAISLLARVLKQREVPYHKWSQGSVLKVITGRGKHSQGAARIRPAVKAYLTSTRRQFHEEPEGQFNVKLIAPV